MVAVPGLPALIAASRQLTPPYGLLFGCSYPRYPAPRLPPRPNPITSCPEPSSVKKFGAKGDGFTDDAGQYAPDLLCLLGYQDACSWHASALELKGALLKRTKLGAPELRLEAVPAVKVGARVCKGAFSCAGALLAASAATSLAFVYLPPGNYRIARSITVTKPLLAGTHRRGAQELPVTYMQLLANCWVSSPVSTDAWVQVNRASL